METLLSLQLLFAALVTGGLYALVAVGLNLVYGTLRLLNVAHGELLMVGAYVSYWMFQRWNVGPLASGLVAMAVTALLGGAAYFGLIRRAFGSAALASRMEANSLLLFFGLSVVLQNVASLAFSASPRAYSYLGDVVRVGAASLSLRNLATIVVSGVACCGTLLVLRGSRTGMALRALIQHREASAIVGIDVGRVQLVSLCMGFAAAGLAGALVSMLEPVNPFMGSGFTMASFVVIILGGLGNLTGSLVAGLLLGAVETYGVALTSPTYRSILIYGVFLAALLLRPQGLFGGTRPAR